ncbi:MAG: bifunctional hydroxymethylpyrimidine kinase/phosphomethylpyrimidine kinase [Pseudomonadota bacterium]
MAFPTALAINASDSSGLDGVQADLRAFSSLKVCGTSAITAITAQNSQTVTAAEMVAPALVEAQIRAVLDDMPVTAVKVGALGSSEMVETVAATLADVCNVPVVVDPFMVARSGAHLADDATVAAFKEHMLPLAAVVTANMAEAALLAGTERAGNLGDMMEQGQAIHEMGAKMVIVTGGHGQSDSSYDIMISAERPPVQLRADRLERKNTRGLSSTLSAGIAAHIAHEFEAYESVQFAKVFVTSALDASDKLTSGAGPGPVHQMHRLW